MDLQLRLETTINKQSNARPKSLILRIPAKVRDILELEPDTQVILDIYQDEKEKYLKMYKKD